MRKFILLSVLMSSFLLTACNEKTHTVEEFKANKTLRDEYQAKCKNGELDGDSLNCQNSRKAVISLSIPTNTGSWTN